MADDNIPQRLDSIETRLEGIETELHNLTGLVTDALADARLARDETRYVSGLMGGVTTAGASLADYVRTLAERVERLEKRPGEN